MTLKLLAEITLAGVLFEFIKGINIGFNKKTWNTPTIDMIVALLLIATTIWAAIQ